MENQNKLFAFLEKNVMGPMGKIAQMKLVRAIMGAGMATIPFTIVGSMFLVFNILPLTFPVLEGFFNATFFKFSDLYMLANSMTMGILALYFCIVLGYEYAQIIAEEDGVDMSGVNGALLSMFAFFMVIPQLVFDNGTMTRIHDLDSLIINGWAIGGDGPSRLGTAGIFTGILMAVLAVQLYRLCVVKKWIVKMPEEVPLGVSRAFTALIPTFVVAFTVLIINGILIALNTDIFQMISIPFSFVANIANSWLGLVVIYFLIHALWLVGIHGANIIAAFINPIALANMALNIEGANFVLAGEFNNAFVTIGGSGATLGLIIFLAFSAKSKQLKILGKASIVPAFFNINEPIIFGLPIIYNPFFAVPFFLAPISAMTIAYVAISTGFASPMIAAMPWPSPVGVGAFIGSGGDWRSGLVAIVGAAVAFLIYLPFIKSYDAKLVKEESESVSEAA